jgi:hypothetical protein
MRVKMKKVLFFVSLIVVCCNAWSGQLGLPEEQIALPAVEGEYLVCVWDEASQQWFHSGVFTFQLPQWGNWYWIGLWDAVSEEYVFGKWIGHFKTD